MLGELYTHISTQAWVYPAVEDTVHSSLGDCPSYPHVLEKVF